MSKKTRNRTGISILIAVLALCTALGPTEKALNAAGLKKLSESNETYLESSFRRSLQTFVVLTAVKTGLAVVEGSEIGIGFGLEVGNVVSAACDYVDIAWKTVLIGMAVLTGTRFILQTAGIFDQWFLFALILSVFLMLLCKWFFAKHPALRRFFRGTAFFTAVAAISLYAVLPLSIAGGRSLSRKITEPSRIEAERGIHQFRSDLFPENPPEREGFFSKLLDVKDKLKRTITYLTQKTNDLISWVVQFIAGYVFDCIVFPLGLFFLFYWVFKFLIRLLLDLKRSQTFREDMEAVLKKYTAKVS